VSEHEQAADPAGQADDAGAQDPPEGSGPAIPQPRGGLLLHPIGPGEAPEGGDQPGTVAEYRLADEIRVEVRLFELGPADRFFDHLLDVEIGQHRPRLISEAFIRTLHEMSVRMRLLRRL
jgi:hypothetical protein